MRATHRNRLAAGIGSIVLIAALTACTSAASVPTTTEAEEPYSVRQSAEQFAGYEGDYDSISSPELAKLSILVATGTVERVQEGRIQIIPESPQEAGISTIVLVLRDVKAVQGNLEEGGDGFIYIELPNPGQREPEAYAEGLRTGARVVSYLYPASDGAPQKDVDTGIADPRAGRPDGQPLYIPSSPQALILQYQGEAVVWPFTGEIRDGRLEDTVPGGSLWAP